VPADRSSGESFAIGSPPYVGMTSPDILDTAEPLVESVVGDVAGPDACSGMQEQLGNPGLDPHDRARDDGYLPAIPYMGQRYT